MIFPSDLILDEDSERGLFYGNEAHNYSKNNLEKQKKLYFHNYKRYIDPENNYNQKKIKSDYPEGHEVSLTTVISQYFSLFKENILKNINEKDIKWILTVPGLWDEKGKELMLTIGNKIGMKNSEIILEQEAASLSVLYDEYINKKHLKKNKSYITIDAGFDSVEICVNKIIDNNKNLKQLMQPLSFRYGSNIINEKIIELIEIVCDEKISKIINNNFDGWQITLDDIELKKKEIDENTTGDINILIPFNNEKFNWLGLKNNWEGKYNNQKISYNRTHIKIPSNIIKTFISDIAFNIIKKIEIIIEKMSIIKEKIEFIYITGGFSNSKILQYEIKKNFDKSHYIFFSDSPSQSIMKGAAIYGLNPNKILFRVSPITIGIGTYIYFEENEGKCLKQIKDEEDQLRCFKFLTFFKKGETIKNNDIISKKFFPLNIKNVSLSIYSAFNDTLTIENSHKFGEIELQLKNSNLPIKKMEIEISLKFSNYIKATISENNLKNNNESIFYYPS